MNDNLMSPVDSLNLSELSDSASDISDSSAPLLYSPRTLNLTIWQDPTCHCCCIGDREMQKALSSVTEREGDVRVNLEYKPFLVDPALPVDKCVSRVSRSERSPHRVELADMFWVLFSKHG